LKRKKKKKTQKEGGVVIRSGFVDRKRKRGGPKKKTVRPKKKKIREIKICLEGRRLYSERGSLPEGTLYEKKEGGPGCQAFTMEGGGDDRNKGHR